jgi:hypothetical protein
MRSQVGDQGRARQKGATQEAQARQRVGADGADCGGHERARDGDEGAVAEPDREIGLGQELGVVLEGERRGPEHRHQAAHLVLGLERRDRHPVERKQDQQQQESEERIGDRGLESLDRVSAHFA